MQYNEYHGWAEGRACRSRILKKDMWNHFSKERRAMVEGGDAFAAMCYLHSKSVTDPLHFTMYTEEDGRLENIFWADSISRIDYECFGDVLSFDSTYKQNKYNRPLVVLSGTNNHGQTVVFGSALLIDERSETYKWVLRVFLECMNGKHPVVVVTDGDVAMRDAINEVFPEAWHRLCEWHLHRNAVENVKNSTFAEDFKTLLYAHFTEMEFEERWKEIVEKYDVGLNKWVQRTYSNKKMWAAAYMRDKFFGGVRTTSRCESVNAIIKKYVEKTNTLVEFIVNYERALKEYRHNELMAEFKTLHSEPVLTAGLQAFQACAAKTFTRKIFCEVKAQIEDVSQINIVSTDVSLDNVTMKMTRYGRPRVHIEVTYVISECKFSCQCRMFESRGIPCAHIFSAMKQCHVPSIPRSLICKRWTKEAKVTHIANICAEEGDSKKGRMMCFAALSAEWNSLGEIAARDREDFNELQNEIVRLKAVLAKRVDDRSKNKPVNKSIGDPCYVKTKGAPLKRKNKWKRRKCSGCGRSGHDIRTCPKRRNGIRGGGQSSDSGSTSDDTGGGGGCDNIEHTEPESVAGDIEDWDNHALSGMEKEFGAELTSCPTVCSKNQRNGAISSDGKVDEAGELTLASTKKAEVVNNKDHPTHSMGMTFTALELLLLMEQESNLGRGNDKGTANVSSTQSSDY